MGKPDSLPIHILSALLDRVQDAVFVVRRGHILYINQSGANLLGYPFSELLSRPFLDFVHPDDRDAIQQRHQARLAGEDVETEYQFRLLTQSGETRDINIRVDLIPERDGNPLVFGSLRDISERKRFEEEIARSQQDIESILANMPDIFYRADMNGIVTMISPSVTKALGYTPKEMIGRPLAEFYCSPEEREKVVQALIAGKGKAKQVEAWLRHKDGTPVWISTNAHIRHDQKNHPLCVEGIARNQTQRKELEQQLSHLARYDELTQILNRRAFLEEAERLAHLAHRYEHPLTVLMLDLDWFKSINDSFGHGGGDNALKYFATCCKAVFRKADVIARMGGEEFAVLMPETDIPSASEVVERLRHHLRQKPMRVDQSEAPIPLTFSGGLVSLNGSDDSIDTMLLRADRLLYKAKETGRNRVIAATPHS